MAEVKNNPEEILEVSQTGENLVKLSKKMVGKLRGFLNKVKNGITTVPYIPGAVFEVAKLHKAKKQKEKEELEKVFDKAQEMQENENLAPQITSEEKQHSELEPKAEEKDETVSVQPEEEPAVKETEEPKEEENKQRNTIQGKTLADLLNQQTEANKNKENEPAQPETVTIEPQAEEKSEPQVEVKAEPEAEQKPKKEKKDLTDLTIFDSYEDYKYAFFWNRFINTYEDVKVLESVSKDFSKYADINRFRTILTEAKFNAKKAEQEKTKEIESIRKAEAEKNAQLDAERDAAIQKAKDDAQSTIDNLQEKLTDARSKNRTLTSKLKVNTEALEQIKEAVAPLGIQKIDDIISTADKKCSGIDERAAERAKAKEESESKIESAKDFDVEAETDRIMKEINEKVYGPKEEVKAENTEKEENKEIETSVAENTNENNEPVNETDNDSLVNELASYDEEPKEVTAPSIFDTTVQTPNVELEPVSMTQAWKLGSVENQMDNQNMDNQAAIDFGKIVTEDTQSKARTR